MHKKALTYEIINTHDGFTLKLLQKAIIRKSSRVLIKNVDQVIEDFNGRKYAIVRLIDGKIVFIGYNGIHIMSDSILTTLDAFDFPVYLISQPYPEYILQGLLDYNLNIILDLNYKLDSITDSMLYFSKIPLVGQNPSLKKYAMCDRNGRLTFKDNPD